MDQAVRATYDSHRDFSQKDFRSGCYAPFVSLNLTPAGDVLACCRNWTYVLGNAGRQDLKDIWKGSEILNLQKAMNDYRFDMGCECCEWQIAEGDYQGVACPHCDSTASVRVHRTPLERILMPWRYGWHKMECDLCRRAFWVWGKPDQ
jgi:hypothetical protein